eukprot:2315908-Rhodomonas_salina.1
MNDMSLTAAVFQRLMSPLSEDSSNSLDISVMALVSAFSTKQQLSWFPEPHWLISACSSDLVYVVVLKMHGVDPPSHLNLPASHAEQGPPSGPRYPTLQVQLDTWVPLAEANPPVRVKLFKGQVVQFAEPGSSEYVPGGQMSQAP